MAGADGNEAVIAAGLKGGEQVVVAGDAPPRDLDMLDERVRSRLSGGLVVPINTFDVELRRAIAGGDLHPGRHRHRRPALGHA